MTDPIETFSQEYLRKRWQLEKDYDKALRAQSDEAGREHIRSKRKQAMLKLEGWLIDQLAAAEGVSHETA